MCLGAVVGITPGRADIIIIGKGSCRENQQVEAEKNQDHPTRTEDSHRENLAAAVSNLYGGGFIAILNVLSATANLPPLR
jgi:hypothetical protein